MPIPELPPLAADHSTLSRRFGPEVANYFAAAPLNRLSFLRTDHAFLSAAFAHPSARFLLLEGLDPLVRDVDDPRELAYVGLADVEALTGSDPLTKPEPDLIRDFDSSDARPLVIFLGIDERDPDGFAYRNYRGSPLFAVDVTPKAPFEDRAKAVAEAVKAKGLSFYVTRMHLTLHAHEAAIYAQARALIDWNTRNPFCGSCGQPTLSVNAGTKRVCPPTDFSGVAPGSPAVARPPCSTRGRGVSNLSFPRTDPTIIVAVCSADGRRILLGRQRRWPPNWYSTLAGFLEPGESVEDAVRREVWEESGVAVGRVVLHLSQPWPYPANLMLGAVATVVQSSSPSTTGEEAVAAAEDTCDAKGTGPERVDLGNDPELEDARWFTLAEVAEALEHGTSGLGEPAPPTYREGALRLPPRTAIANQLLQAVVHGGFVTGGGDGEGKETEALVNGVESKI